MAAGAEVRNLVEFVNTMMVVMVISRPQEGNGLGAQDKLPCPEDPVLEAN